MSDVARKQYMSELSKPSKASVQPSSKQHKKQMSFAKKNLLKQKESRRAFGEDEECDSDGRPALTSDSERDEYDASDFDSEEEFGYRKKAKGRRVFARTQRQPALTVKQRQKLLRNNAHLTPTQKHPGLLLQL